MIEANNNIQARKLAKNFFNSHPESNQILIPMPTKKIPLIFDYAPIIDGKLNGIAIDSIDIHHCQSCNVGCLPTKCDTHIINISSAGSTYYLQNGYTNSNRLFSYDELCDLGYLDYIRFVVSHPSLILEKCDLAKKIGKNRIFVDYD